MQGSGARLRICAVLTGAGLITALLAGCGSDDKTLSGPGDHDSPASSASSSTAAASSSAAPTTTPAAPSAIKGDPRSPITWKVRQPGGSSDVAAVLRAYQSYLNATTQLKGKPQANSPLIPLVATGAAQSQLAASVTALAQQHQQVYGPITSYPQVTETDAASGEATVLDCPNFSHFLTGGKASGQTQLRRPLKATLSNGSGTWKIDTYASTDMSACVGVQ